MALWQEILSTYGDACLSMSFVSLADEFCCSPASIGRAIAAIEARNSACGKVYYSDGSSKQLSKKPIKKKKKGCGCRR
jgi:hypothetical protein